MKAIPRPAARILLINQHNQVLLFRSVVFGQEQTELWITPGGALESHEDYEQAALRELWEETGLTGVSLGPWIWTRQHTWRWDDRLIDSYERFFLIRTADFDVNPAALEPIEVDSLRQYRWWTVSEIEAASSHETFVPRRLVALLEPIMAGVIPSKPVEIGA